jgi:hypothetical protein
MELTIDGKAVAAQIGVLCAGLAAGLVVMVGSLQGGSAAPWS